MKPGQRPRKKAPPPVIRDRVHGCLLWCGKLDSDGYGDPGRGPRAHVLAFRRSGRRSKPGEQIDHVCRMPACIEPRHLESVSRMVNNLRRASGYRHRLERCPMGHTLATPIYSPNGGRLCRICIAHILRADEASTVAYRVGTLERLPGASTPTEGRGEEPTEDSTNGRPDH